MDAILSILLCAATILMGYLGIHVSIHPASESRSSRIAYKVGFASLAFVALILVGWKELRNVSDRKVSDRQQREGETRLAALQARLEASFSDLNRSTKENARSEELNVQLLRTLLSQNSGINTSLKRQDAAIMQQSREMRSIRVGLIGVDPVRAGQAQTAALIPSSKPVAPMDWDFTISPYSLNGITIPNGYVFKPVFNETFKPGNVSWNFGDGSAPVLGSADAPVAHVFGDSKPYVITLSVAPPDGRVFPASNANMKRVVRH